MHEFASLNNEILPTTSVRISAMSAAALYGRGVFTTVAIIGGEPFLWEKHGRRLREHAAQIGMANADQTSVEAAVREVIERNRVTNGRARITVFDESPAELWASGGTSGASVLIVTADRRKPAQPFQVTLSPYRINSTSPLAGIKSSNYLEKLLAMNDARGRGFNECIQLNERSEPASAAMANIFWVKDGTLFTPALEAGCLAGTTREHVIENLQLEESVAGLNEVRQADDIFLTSAGLGVVQVQEFDGRPMMGNHHAISELFPARSS